MLFVMFRKVFLLGFGYLMIFNCLFSQNMKLPYASIPENPKAITSANVVARMIDGLGYRYYWATQGLTEIDLKYKPSSDARSCRETIEHIFGLSQSLVNSLNESISGNLEEVLSADFEVLREKTLLNLQEASEVVKQMSNEELEEMRVIFMRSQNPTEYPLWNLLNGPLSDALYHVGQVVSFRRSSGNPINPNVNVFIGKNRE
jgi:uncharacterized damage-inducible protein DinB